VAESRAAAAGSEFDTEARGMVVSGCAAAAFDDGRVIELGAGELFHIPAVPDDSWVVGDDSYISIYFLGADHSAN
jgi:hypothetical protein